MNRGLITHLKRAANRDEGQAIILLAAGALFFVALLAVVGDTALAYMQRRDLQNTADAAALAGAQELDGSDPCPDEVVDDAIAWAEKNISDLSATPDVDVLDDCTKVRVRVQKPSGSLFGGMLGFGEQERQATAAARIASLNSLAPCVVPLGIQYGFYLAGITDPDAIVQLKVAVNDSDTTSNTGTLDLDTPANLAPYFATGVCNGLEPTVETYPGNRIGQIRRGFGQRLSAAIANDCYTEEEIRADFERCKPDIWGTGVQATALMLLPILEVDIVQSGKTNLPVMQTDDGLYVLAYFWIDGEASFTNLPHSNPTCADSCNLYGKWMLDVPVDLTVFDPAQCPPAPAPCVIDYDPNSLVKIVMLDE